MLTKGWIDTLAEMKFLWEFLLAGLGTFSGAWFAFRFERRSKSEDQAEGRRSALRKTLFVLAMQRSFLENFIRLYLEPYQEDPIRWRRLPQFLQLPLQEQLDLEGLSFLLDSEASELLYQVSLGQSQFRTLLGVIDARNAAHGALIKRLVCVMETHSPLPTPEDMDTLLGPDITEPLQGLTDGLYEAADNAQRANLEDFAAVSKHFRKKNPGEPLPELKPVQGTFTD